eukprot:c13480_g1_i2.p1 GENE.c13480_g1_i2~~c13480_g1_i2.p1  ORF type:complete len:468 (+),score=107.36 c13480_g1_i2:49-1404(+)
MAISSCESCIRYLEPIQAHIEALPADQRAQYRIESLPALHSRTIRRLYGPERGAEVVLLIMENTSAVVGVVLGRLRNRHTHLATVRQESQRVWRELCARNDSKSLDHRSYHFKQVDKRYLTQRGVLNEIKDVIESAVGTEACIEVDMNNQPVHTLISELVLPTAKRLLGISEAPKVESFWNTRVVAFFQTNDGSCDKSGSVLYGNNALYVLFRLYSVLYTRLAKLQSLCELNANRVFDSKPSLAMTLLSQSATGHGHAISKSSIDWSVAHRPPLPHTSPPLEEEDAEMGEDDNGSEALHELNNMPDENKITLLHKTVMESIHRLLDGAADPAQFEDECRVLLGPDAYEMFTVDRLVAAIVRQTNALLNNVHLSDLLGHFDAFRDRDLDEEGYRQTVADTIKDDNCYRVELVSNLTPKLCLEIRPVKHLIFVFVLWWGPDSCTVTMDAIAFV